MYNICFPVFSGTPEVRKHKRNATAETVRLLGRPTTAKPAQSGRLGTNHATAAKTHRNTTARVTDTRPTHHERNTKTGWIFATGQSRLFYRPPENVSRYLLLNEIETDEE